MGYYLLQRLGPLKGISGWNLGRTQAGLDAESDSPVRAMPSAVRDFREGSRLFKIRDGSERGAIPYHVRQ